ncbi:hypothetical protein EAH_00064520 [Eimeria acervulina]|uniref:Uncharacterized protein n=1 Tax=Eimeria acervulina TaxID=5801 RepID=U6GS31_EIMAC|nr:hypothetical protein EAH_00064520 [Eimeria acervulina]CDI82058.1 hypothetical protein EAH_00064520 [Eimeria acervulina]
MQHSLSKDKRFLENAKVMDLGFQRDDALQNIVEVRVGFCRFGSWWKKLSVAWRRAGGRNSRLLGGVVNSTPLSSKVGVCKPALYIWGGLCPGGKPFSLDRRRDHGQRKKAVTIMAPACGREDSMQQCRLRVKERTRVEKPVACALHHGSYSSRRIVAFGMLFWQRAILRAVCGLVVLVGTGNTARGLFLNELKGGEDGCPTLAIPLERHARASCNRALVRVPVMAKQYMDALILAAALRLPGS